MYTIINKIKLSSADHETLDGKELIAFEIRRPFTYSKEIQAFCKLPYYGHSIGYCNTVKQAEQLISEYYQENCDKLLQLKQLGNLRCDLIKKIKEGEIKEPLPCLISKDVTAVKFPLVNEFHLRDTVYELYRAAERS